MRFRAYIQAMAESEIKAMIPPYYFEDIKRRDPKPLYKAFIIGQEGQSEANWIGVGKIVKTWFADAIGKIARRIYSGMRVFHNHAVDTNAHEGREEVGEVAGVQTKELDGKFSAIIAAYIYPEYRDLPLDIASIEAEVNIDNPDTDIHAVDVQEVTGIALGSSKISRPGFPGATLLGELQAMHNNLQLGHKVEDRKLALGFEIKNTGQPGRRFRLTEEA